MQLAECRRCGSKSKAENGVTELPKCSKCEHIKFEREFFEPIKESVILNYQKARSSKFGEILKNLYIFGSYIRNEAKCGDIDFLITYSEPKLQKFTTIEISNFRSKFDRFFQEMVYLHKLKPFLENSSWDFRTCQDFPDCLSCYGSPHCKLPARDYNSAINTFCLEKCKSEMRRPIPICCFQHCIFLKWGIRSIILAKIGEIMKTGINEFHELDSKLRIKILDLVYKPTIKKLKDEFEHKKPKTDFQLFKIESVNK